MGVGSMPWPDRTRRPTPAPLIRTWKPFIVQGCLTLAADTVEVLQLQSSISRTWAGFISRAALLLEPSPPKGWGVWMLGG